MLPIEQCYGVVVVFKDKENQFLLLRIKSTLDEFWTFPKGHHEGAETPKETALRELKEEAGIDEVEFLDFPLIREEYEIERNGEKRLKVNEYFIGLVKNKDVTIDMDEIGEYKWCSYEEAFETFKFWAPRQDVVKHANEYLKNL